jgi:hypothetical protein
VLVAKSGITIAIYTIEILQCHLIEYIRNRQRCENPWLDPSIEVRAIGKIGDDEPGRFAVGTLELEKKFKRRNVCWST